MTEELQKSNSIYLNRIKTNIAKKTSSEFNIRKSMSVERMMTRMKTTKERKNAFGSIYSKKSPPHRAQSNLEGRPERTNRKMALITRDHETASVSSFNTAPPMPEHIKNRLQIVRAQLALQAK